MRKIGRGEREAQAALAVEQRERHRERDRARVAGIRGEGGEALVAHAVHVDHELLGDAAGAAARTPAAVVAGFSEQLAVRLDEWWSYPSFGEQERSALAVAEQFVVDVHGVSDERFASLAKHLGDAGAVAFSMALALFDGQSRLRLAFAAPDLSQGDTA